MTFVKNELRKFKKILIQECSERLRADDEVVGDEEEDQSSSNSEAFLKIMEHFLRKMKQEQLVDSLQSSKIPLRTTYEL